jgi:glucosamine--fructose-6-phosphate aminotransferase (isomerizing)
MCGIMGYVGQKNAPKVIINGLKRLEYRGYDSAGVALLCGDQLNVVKKKGKISVLESQIKYADYEHCHAGIGHTRWATHGAPSDVNSHPHMNCSGDIAVVHNGIIENYVALKKKLTEMGHTFSSETDSEVVVHLIEQFYTDSLLGAVTEALAMLEGTYGLAIISAREPGKIIAAKKGSPLVVGIGDGEIIVASDCSAIVELTRSVIYVEDNEIVEVTAGGINTYGIDRQKIAKKIENIDWDLEGIEKGGYAHFMLKEIHEQPDTILDAFRGRLLPESGTSRLDGLNLTAEDIKGIERIIFIACGTSWHAGLIGEYLIEEYARIPVEVEYASEFRYRRPILKKGDLVIVISQSGETADTLAALREAKERGVKVLAITNVVGSTIARESDGGVYIHAGPEIGVASTKAFTSQVTVLVLLTILLSRKNMMTLEEGASFIEELRKIPDIARKVLANESEIEAISEIFKDARNFLYLGRGCQYPVALEGALKLKEISYIHAEGYPAAEMKHGPIALIDENMPVVIVALKDEVYTKVLSNIQEVKARGGRIIVIATEGDDEISKYAEHVIYLPPVNKMVSPLLTVIPLQLLSYYIAVKRGCDVDQPRNLAKSVTVE